MKIPEDFTIETGRCRLRAPTRSDIPHIFAATRHAGFNDGMVWDPPNDESELIPPYEHSIANWRKGERFSFTIEGRESREFIGRIAIRREMDDGVWSIGFFTHPDHQNRGYMTEVARAVLGFGFETLGATSIEAAHALWNSASAQVLERIGMRFVEDLPQGFLKGGDWVAEKKLAITREGWEASRDVACDADTEADQAPATSQSTRSS